MFKNIKYSENEDVKTVCKAGRSFFYLHKEKPDIAVLCIHGYTGYPGELIRPAYDFYKAGYDVFVPRLKGHGTDSTDFMSTCFKDWLKSAENCYEELLKKYEKVYITGHSMGCAIAVLICRDNSKLLLAAPALSCTGVRITTRLTLFFLSLFIRRKPLKWKSNSAYNMHYENAPADDAYLGSQYWSYLYPKQLLSCIHLMDMARKKIRRMSDFMVLVPEKDKDFSVCSLNFLKKKMKNKFSYVLIPNGTHFVFYDIDPSAEEQAVKAAVDFYVG